MSDGTREQLFIVHLYVDDIDYGIFDKSSSWVRDSTLTKYRSGGQPDEETLGGPNIYSDITLDRNYRLSRDYPLIAPLMAACGTGKLEAYKQPLNRDYSAYNLPMVAKGVLKSVSDPAADSNSANAAMLTIVFEVNSISQVSTPNPVSGAVTSIGAAL